MPQAAVNKRELCVRRLSDIFEIASAAATSADSRAMLLANYTAVAPLVKEFEVAHLKIMQDTEADFDAEDAVRARFDRMHYGIRGIYHSLTSETSRGVMGAGTQQTVSKIKLPKISLPQFSGELALWPSFIALFNTSIHRNAQLADIEKYQYLVASLRGDALSVIKNLPLSPEHYDIAYESLISRYQNKRKLATHYWDSVVNAKPLKGDSAEALRALIDGFTENLRALQLMEFPTRSWDFVLLNILLNKLTPSLRERFEAEHRKTEIPTYEQLADFLEEYCRVFASLSSSPVTRAGGSSKGGAPKSVPSVSTFVTGTASCPCCKESHGITKCPSFLQLSEKDRYVKARELRLCLNCLKSSHRVNKCPSSWVCRTCDARHHTLLHFPPKVDAGLSSEVASPSVGSGSPGSGTSVEGTLVSMTSASRSATVVLLATIRAEMADARGRFFPVRVLLDSASQSNFITEGCIRRGGLVRSPYRSAILGVNDAEVASARGRASIVIRAVGREDSRMPMEVIILPRISSHLSDSTMGPKVWPHLQGLELADPDYQQPGSIDVLLGAECFVSVLREGLRKGGAGEPDALNTMFGWVLMGTVSAARAHPVSSFVTTMGGLDDTLRKFWATEEVPDRIAWSDGDRCCERHFEETTRRDPSGRFIVSYPFVGDPPCFVDSRQIALSRLRSLERRFRTDPILHSRYNEFMREYLDSGHMELVRKPAPVDGRVYYVPHHGVLKLDSETTKLRVVFDASSKCTNGIALNETLRCGPKLQQDLASILLRFRFGAVALTADVKQMFRQIWIEPSQRDYQRVVWRFSEEDPILDYRLTTVAFGVTPSPYLAIRCLLQLAQDGADRYPLAARALQSALYVDDIVIGVESVGGARALRSQLNDLLQQAGFVLRKWASSHAAVLGDADPAHCSASMLSFDSGPDDFLKVLGLRWSARSDCFGFQVRPLHRHCSKRIILSELARMFDPLGFLAPLTFTAKRLIQQLWTLGLDWDDQVPPEICDYWHRYQQELPELGSIRIPRSLSYESTIRLELHGFSDASERGYGAVVYLRVVTADKKYIRLLTAKSKVAPLKSLSLPRLELCAALLLSKLLRYLTEALRASIRIDDIFAWSDSTVVLAWIRASPHRLETFVRNRVAQIQEYTHAISWGHVGTKSNPADHCSRGLFPRELVECRLWWAGPDWLPEFEHRADVDSTSGNLETEEASGVALLSAGVTHRFTSLLTRFSSLGKICRVVAYCLRFMRGSQRKSVPESLAVDQLEAHAALLELVRAVQEESFADDRTKLRERGRVSRELRGLAPFLDSRGIIRVGGRIACADLSYEARHPALLPNKHRLTELLIERVHKKNLHPGRRALQYLLTQNFWVLGVQRAIKRTLSRCYRCFRANPRTVQPYMADLPAERVQRVKPFAVTGVDYAGPFPITPYRTRGSRSVKAYVCLFVCFATKAVHLELAFSLSTDAFLAALRRFISRRGRCSLLFSDCGTNFIGAHRELSRHMALASETEQIRWSFNPPAAPHFGGLWEAGVKSFKTHLARVVGEQVLSVEEFGTVLAQVEAVLNSRPLCPLSSDPNDLTVLSPGHFLTTETLTSLPGPDLTAVPMNRVSRWQLVQRIHQDFWKRWSREYLQTLQQRSKWLAPGQSIGEGRLVLIKEANASPLRWRLGRIVTLHPGRDGVFRVATVRTTEGELTRPLVKLCPLPMGDSPGIRA